MARNQNANSTNTTKKTTRKKRRTPKPKVYIAPYKIIILCASIITVCMLLLLATTLMSKPESTSIAQRYEKEQSAEQEIKTPVIEKKADENKAKQEAPKTVKKQETKPAPVEKKSEPKKQPEKVPEKEPVKEPVKEKKAAVPVPAPVVEKQEKPAPAPAPQKADFDFPAAKNGAQLIFVFDDGGHNINQAKAFLDLPFPYTVAVLPRLKASKETADLIRNSGNEVILHQPMQAINLNVDPGEGAIKPDMTESEIRSTLFQNVTEIAPIAGMNNHEGSAITADAEKMAVVLQFCSSEGIFFLDSRTNSKTAVPYVAKELGYSYYERNIFLDNEKTRDNILKELRKGLDIANKKGSCIMIGHIWSAEILPKVLLEVYPELKEKGYTFSVVSKSKARIYN